MNKEKNSDKIIVEINAILNKNIIPISCFQISGKLFKDILFKTLSGRNSSNPVKIAIANNAGVILLKFSNIFSIILSTDIFILIPPHPLISS